jgi:RimJ/RimL family protein N-acetyltransferase
MRSGKIVEDFEIDGERFIFRYPRFEDYLQFQKHFSRLIDEGAEIGLAKKYNREKEIELVANILKMVENKQATYFVVESKGRLIGQAHIYKKTHTKSHIGELGISLDKETRSKGIGTKLMEAVIKEAKKNLKIELIELEGFSQNKAALGLYKKMGFQIVGTVKKGLKRNGKYFDGIMMVKYLR